MIRIDDLTSGLARDMPEEFARFRAFLDTHAERELRFEGHPIGYCDCGSGRHTILLLAGGWGGIELSYETLLALEGDHRLIAVDISAFGDPDAMTRGIDAVLDACGAERVVLMGQSLGGMLAQLYFRRRSDRVSGLILTQTLAPDRSRCRRGARLLMSSIPLPLFRLLIRRKMRRLGKTEQAVPPEIERRRAFAGALLVHTTSRALTRPRLRRILQLVWAFNEAGAYATPAFPDWPGQCLVVASPDDPNHADALLLATSLPSARQAALPSGYGHLAPQMYPAEYHALVRTFIAQLDS